MKKKGSYGALTIGAKSQEKIFSCENYALIVVLGVFSSKIKGEFLLFAIYIYICLK